MTSLTITIENEVWRYPGPGGWHFVSAGRQDSERLKAEKRINRTGFGYVPVVATLGSSEWKTTLFPSKDGPFLLAIKANVRAKERVTAGDRVKVQCVIALADLREDFF